jgi:hypothetical protein
MLEDIREAKRVQELTAQAAERLRVMVENLSVGAVQVRSTLLVLCMLVTRVCACLWIEFERICAPQNRSPTATARGKVTVLGFEGSSK